MAQTASATFMSLLLSTDSVTAGMGLSVRHEEVSLGRSTLSALVYRAACAAGGSTGYLALRAMSHV